MLENIPKYITAIFIITTLITLFGLYWVIKSSENTSNKRIATKILVFLVFWLIIQSIMSFKGIYSKELDKLPPRIFLFGVLPNILLIALLFFTKNGKRFIDRLSIHKLTYINLVRIPVEFILLWISIEQVIPNIMTFEGWNFDILAGITSPFIIYFGFVKHKIKRQFILTWNIIGLLLLIFIFLIALFSAPFPIQQLAYNQPNIGLLYFPFSWLPTFIVPIVMFGHLVSIRKLLKK